MSLVEPDFLLVDQVSMLTSSAGSTSELRLSSIMPGRPLCLKPESGFANCEIEGRCALERRLGNEFCDLAKSDAEACEIGDCMLISPGKVRAFGVQDFVGDVCDICVVRSSTLGRYRGFRMGHEMPACSKTSVPN